MPLCNIKKEQKRFNPLHATGSRSIPHMFSQGIERDQWHDVSGFGQY